MMETGRAWLAPCWMSTMTPPIANPWRKTMPRLTRTNPWHCTALAPQISNRLRGRFWSSLGAQFPASQQLVDGAMLGQVRRHQHKFFRMPSYGFKHHLGRAARVAQQGNVWFVGALIKFEARGFQAFLQSIHQLNQSRRRILRAQKPNLVVPPAGCLFEAEGMSPTLHMCCQRAQFIQTLSGRVAQKHQTHVQGIRLHAPATPDFVQASAGFPHGTADIVRRPKREKQAKNALAHERPRTMRQTAWAAIPSSRPVNPRNSVVVALTLTHPPSTRRSAATLAAMPGI